MSRRVLLQGNCDPCVHKVYCLCCCVRLQRAVIGLQLMVYKTGRFVVADTERAGSLMVLNTSASSVPAAVCFTSSALSDSAMASVM